MLYVELLSPEGGPVKTHKYKIEDGMCHGEFYLDSAYLSGFFEVRAYTRHMRNYGEDNYFTRVFPVFDIVFQGDYGYRRIYDRTRPDLLNKHKKLWIDYKEDWKRLKEKAKAKKEPLPDSVLQIMQAVGRYNQDFHAAPIRCLTPQPGSLKPGEKIELTFRTTPGSRFSLAVTDASSRIPTNYGGDIHRSLFLDSSWVARSYYAMRNFDPEQDIFLSPEKRTDRGRGGLYTLIAQTHQEARTGMPRQNEHTGRHLQNDRRDNHHRKGILGLLPERLPWRQNRLPLHILRRSGRERGRHQNL